MLMLTIFPTACTRAISDRVVNNPRHSIINGPARMSKIRKLERLPRHLAASPEVCHQASYCRMSGRRAIPKPFEPIEKWSDLTKPSKPGSNALSLPKF
jgi:hypothetical protein